MPTYPNDSPDLTVERWLRDSTMTARALTDLTYKRFAADKLLLRGSPDQVASGSAVYSRSESIFPDRDVRELALRTQYPRTGWSEELKTAVVKKYGLEAPIAYESIRRNSRDQLAIALRKIANSMVRFVDGLAMSMLLNDTDTLGAGASADWSVDSTDIRKDILTARAAIINLDEGYDPQTLVLNPAQEFDIETDTVLADIYSAFKNGSSVGATNLVPGTRLATFLGFSQVVVTPALAATNVLVMDASLAGTVADEAPSAGEGYSTFSPGPSGPFGQGDSAPVYSKVMDEEETDTKVIRGVRWPAMWLSEPKAIYHMTGA